MPLYIRDSDTPGKYFLQGTEEGTRQGIQTRHYKKLKFQETRSKGFYPTESKIPFLRTRKYDIFTSMINNIRINEISTNVS